MHLCEAQRPALDIDQASIGSDGDWSTNAIAGNLVDRLPDRCVPGHVFAAGAEASLASRRASTASTTPDASRAGSATSAPSRNGEKHSAQTREHPERCLNPRQPALRAMATPAHADRAS